MQPMRWTLHRPGPGGVQFSIVPSSCSFCVRSTTLSSGTQAFAGVSASVASRLHPHVVMFLHGR